MSTMSAKGLAKYAAFRLAREQEAINDAIWRFNEILRENQAEIAELNVLIRKEEDKTRFLADLITKMIQSFDDVDEKREILNKMTGTAPGESGGGISVPLDVLTPRVKKDHP
jgi:hypothetical protein